MRKQKGHNSHKQFRTGKDVKRDRNGRFGDHDS